MKKTKRILAMSLGVLMTLSMSISGAETTKSIMAGIDHIKGGQQSNIYFGRYQQSSLGNTRPTEGKEGVDWIKSDTAINNGQGAYYSKDAIKWRVLEVSTTDRKALLLSDQNLDVLPYHIESDNATWETRTMRSWLNGYGISPNFIGSAFSAAEKGVIADTNVINATYDGTAGTNPNPSYSTSGGNDTTDKVFLLSIAELNNINYFANKNTKKATNTAYVYGGGKNGTSIMYGAGTAEYWWLRSPGSDSKSAALVYDGGVVSSKGANVNTGRSAIRPAFNLQLSPVLFTSAAKDGKPDGFGKVADYSGSDWKLTLYDESRNGFNAGIIKTDTKTVVSYTGAVTGTNEYISAIIKDNDGNVTYYGRLKNITDAADTSGTVELNLSGVTMNSGDTLYIFNEQYNGDYMTDYAGEFISKEITPFEIKAHSINGNKTNAEVIFPMTGTYTVVFADYEEAKLNKLDAVEVKVENTGKLTVTSEKDITLSKGDKIMLWGNLTSLEPKCNAYVVE